MGTDSLLTLAVALMLYEQLTRTGLLIKSAVSL